MPDESSIVRDIQLTIRRELDRRGRSLKGISFDSGIPYSTLLSYFPGERDAVPHALPLAAVRKLIGHIPSVLLSLLLPDEYVIVRVPEGVDYDRVSSLCRDFIGAKEDAHHPESPAGRDISGCESAMLDRKVVQLRSVA